MIEKIYIVWHKQEQRDRLISKIESMFDIPYQAIKGPNGNDIEFQKMIGSSSGDGYKYKPVENWKLTDGENPITYKEEDYTWSKYDNMALQWDGDKRSRDHKYGELASGIAHYRAWKQAKKDGVKKALILEQDADIKSEHPVKIKQFIDTVDDFDVMYIGNCIASVGIHREVCRNIVEPNFLYCLHAYILSDKGIGKLVEEFEDNVCVADEYIPAKFENRSDRVHPSLRHLKNNLKVYAIHPRIIKQLEKDESGSSTEFSEYYR
jgi:hypothetical protein